MSDQPSEDEPEHHRLGRGLAALANMDVATRDAYLAELKAWDDAPLDEQLTEPPSSTTPPLTAEELLARWRKLPRVDAATLRADLDELLDAQL